MLMRIERLADIIERDPANRQNTARAQEIKHLVQEVLRTGLQHYDNRAT